MYLSPGFLFYTCPKGGDAVSYPEKTVFNELKWEYGWPDWVVVRVIAWYKAKGQYTGLCKALETRGGLKCIQ